MKLEKKRELASRALGVGKNRIVFNTKRLSEVKEAITKQDIRDLQQSGAITLSEIKGRKKAQVSSSRKRSGSFRAKVNLRKKKYIQTTRKLRSYLKNLKNKGVIKNEKFKELRKEIRASNFKNLAHLKERLSITEEKNENTKKTKKRSKN